MLTIKSEGGIIYERLRERKSFALWKLNKKRQFKNKNFRKQRTQSSFIESNQMESLILAQDERWRHA